MFGRLFRAYQQLRRERARRSIHMQFRSLRFRSLRFRPGIEMLETRLAPSISPLPTLADTSALQSAQFAVIHVANFLPGAINEQPPGVLLLPAAQTPALLLTHGMIALPTEASSLTKFELPTGTD